MLPPILAINCKKSLCVVPVVSERVDQCMAFTAITDVGFLTSADRSSTDGTSATLNAVSIQ